MFAAFFYLLRSRGLEVHGLYLDNAGEDARQDAVETARVMGIPLTVRDVKAELEEKVCAPFAACYLRGETPNPCVLCNPAMKFKNLLAEAERLGAEKIATGHYARAEGGALYKGRPSNDQSYMLCRLEREQLRRLVLPLGGFEKTQTRALAETLRLPVAAFFGAAILYSLIAYTTGAFQRWQGIAFLCLFVCYMVLTVRQMKKHPEQAGEDAEETEIKDRPLWQELVFLAVGAAAIAVGANLLVDNGTKIAAALGVPDSVIGLTMVALGTSLPELVTAITALAKGHSALSLGNIIGANLFNIVLVSGAAITISPFAIPVEKTLLGHNASLLVDIPVMLAVMSVLCFPALAKGKLARWQGVLLLCVYVAFTAFQFAT